MSVVDWGIDAHLRPSPDEATLPDRQAEAAAANRREQELVERARRGDVDAYEALLLEHERFAYRMAYLITRDPSDAEDALQDAFVKAFRALGRFRRGAAFRPWLLKIVTNEARTRSRSRRRHAAIVSRATEREPRLAANTLVWQRGDLTLRLEGDLSKPAAIRLAESFVPDR